MIKRTESVVLGWRHEFYIFWWSHPNLSDKQWRQTSVFEISFNLTVKSLFEFFKPVRVPSEFQVFELSSLKSCK